MGLLIHQVSRKHLDAFSGNLPQSLLLHGKNGVGLGTIARFLAGKELAELLQPTDTKGNTDSGGTISIEAIRRLYEQTKTKQTSKRVIIIDNAERMSKGAQAGFLKLLEEPNGATHFILTAHEPELLLSTIRSRVQEVAFLPLPAAESDAFIAAQVSDPQKCLQLAFIAGGLPAEITRLLADSSYFAQKAKIITDARTLLQADTYQKLRLVHSYRSSRDEALQLIDGATAIIKHTLAAKPQQTLVHQLSQLLEAKEQIASGFNIPLTLARIVL